VVATEQVVEVELELLVEVPYLLLKDQVLVGMD
jgi:hypothetical protein